MVLQCETVQTTAFDSSSRLRLYSGWRLFCDHNRQNIFGEIRDEEMILSTLGCIVDEEWQRTAVLRPYVELDVYVIMPNHLHGILVINHGGDTDRTQHAASLPSTQIRNYAICGISGAIVNGLVWVRRGSKQSSAKRLLWSSSSNCDNSIRFPLIRVIMGAWQTQSHFTDRRCVVAAVN